MPKYLDIAAAIETRINLGHQNVRMPTVRGLADEFSVSIVTASRALQVLRDKGLIRIVERSGSSLRLPDAVVPECYALVQNLTPNAWRNATIAMTQGPFETHARESGCTLFTQTPTPASIRTHAIRGLFLLPSRVSDAMAAEDERLIEMFRAADLPIVLIERNLRGDTRPLTLDLVAADDFEGGHLLTRHLLGQGRERVAFVTGSPTSTHNNRLAGYLFALHRLGGTSARPLVVEEPGGMPTKRAYRDLADRLLAAGTDAVVCYQDYTAIGLIVEFMARGVAVPGSIAVVGFDNLPIGDSFAIGVTTYSFPAERVARSALDRLRWRADHPNDPPVKIVVPGELIVRESSVAK